MYVYIRIHVWAPDLHVCNYSVADMMKFLHWTVKQRFLPWMSNSATSSTKRNSKMQMYTRHVSSFQFIHVDYNYDEHFLDEFGISLCKTTADTMFFFNVHVTQKS